MINPNDQLPDEQREREMDSTCMSNRALKVNSRVEGKIF